MGGHIRLEARRLHILVTAELLWRNSSHNVIYGLSRGGNE